MVRNSIGDTLLTHIERLICLESISLSCVLAQSGAMLLSGLMSFLCEEIIGLSQFDLLEITGIISFETLSGFSKNQRGTE